jgi:hypothetical protein
LAPWDDIEKVKSYRQARNSNRPFTGIAMLFVHPFGAQWRKGIPDIECWLEKKVRIEPGSGFPSNGIAFHLVTPQDWKRFSIPETSSVSSPIGEASESSENVPSVSSQTSPDGIHLGLGSYECHRRADR